MNRPPDRMLLTTPWFSVVEKPGADEGPGQFVIDSPDFVVVLALDGAGRILLVRQFRPAVDQETLELPAGMVDPGYTPEETARKELLEETGYDAGPLEQLAVLSASTARFRNRMWCFLARDVRPAANASEVREPGLELVVYDRGWRALLGEPGFIAGSSCATLFAALARGRLPG